VRRNFCVRCPMPELLPSVAQEHTLLVRERRTAMIRRPVRKSGNEGNGVAALALPLRDGLFEADSFRRHVVGRGQRTLPRQAPRSGGEPRVADEKERHTVGIAQSVAVFARSNETTTIGILEKLRVIPRYGAERASPAVEPRIVRAVRSGTPAPIARLRGNETHLESPSAVPESVHAPLEVGPLEIDPKLDIDVWVCVFACGLERHFLHLPHAHFA